MPFLGNFELQRMTPLATKAFASDMVQLNTTQSQQPLVEVPPNMAQADVAGSVSMSGSMCRPGNAAPPGQSDSYLPWIIGAAAVVGVLWYIRS